MALPDGYIPPERLRTAFEKMLSTVPDERMLAFVRGGDVQPRGFRLTPESVPRLRAWLLPVFFRKTPVAQSLASILREYAPAARVVAILSRRALENLLPWIEAVAGEEYILAGMLMDQREEVREAAQQRLRSPQGDKKNGQGAADGGSWPEPETARKTLAERIAPLADIAGLGAASAEVPSAPCATAATSKADKPSGHEKRRLHAMERRCRELAQRLEEQAGEAAESKIREKRLLETRAKVEKELAELKQEWIRLRQTRKARIAEEVEDRLRDEVYSWLRTPRRVERALGRKKDAAVSANGEPLLIERVDELLTRQMETDRHYGNLVTLEREVEALEKARDRIRRARRESVNPLPELAELDVELSREMDRLGAVMPEKSGAADSTAERLAAEISQSDPNRLVFFTSLLESLKSAGILNHNETLLLENGLRRRQKRAVAESLVAEDPKNARPEDPLWQMDRALRHRQRLHILVDGHNCLFGLRARYHDGFDARERPGARARNALISDLKTMVQSCPDCRVKLYFDGPERSETGVLPNLQVIYSGGGESEHRADRALLEYLNYLREKDTSPVVMVSNDADMRFKARGREAVPCSPADLERFFV